MNKNIIRHGELILKKISALPKNLKLQEESENLILAHSETGHHHVLTTSDLSKAKVWNDEQNRYVEFGSLSRLWHQKAGAEKHTEHQLEPGIYQIIIKKEYDYFAKKIREVRD